MRRTGVEAPAEENEEPPTPAIESASSRRRRSAIIEGTLRAPWKWEKLIVESAVIGGDPARWHRRLRGLANELRRAARRRAPRRSGLARRSARIERDLRNLGHLRAFALPIVDRLASWPASATWGEWLDRFVALAPMVLSQPERVLARARTAAPDGGDRPGVARRSARRVADRLQMLEVDPPRSRYGRVFVGGPQQARGRTFRVVFVAGPGRADVSAASARGSDAARSRDARAARRRAVDAAGPRRAPNGCCCVSPWARRPSGCGCRIRGSRLAESRPRVPSFYALDVMRAITGRIPQPQQLQDAGGGRRRAPASPGRRPRSPRTPSTISSTTSPSSAAAAGRAARLGARPRALPAAAERIAQAFGDRALGARPLAVDAVRRHHARHRHDQADAGVAAARRAAVFAVGAAEVRGVSRISSCSRRSTGSSRRRDIEPLQKLDPLTRGSIFHEAQARFFRALKRTAACRLREADIAAALATLDAVIAAVAASVQGGPRAGDRSRLARRDRGHRPRPARLGRAGCRRPDRLGARLLRVRVRPAGRRGPRPGQRRRSRCSSTAASSCAARSILIESEARRAAELRITDHKTGKNRTTWKTVIGGGAILQPVLYSLAIEQALQAQVQSGRLFYCTSAGGFVDHEIPLNEHEPAHRARGAGDRRSRDRARLPAGGAGAARLHLVRLPPGLRPRRAAPRRATRRPRSSAISKR